MRKVSCLLRVKRLGVGLHQKDLAMLLPHAGSNRVSVVERTLRPPNAQEILAYPLVFGTLPEEIFPGLVEEVEDAVLRNAYRIHRSLEKDRSDRAVRMRHLLEDILARAKERASQRGV
jgi:hypothetical protein